MVERINFGNERKKLTFKTREEREIEKEREQTDRRRGERKGGEISIMKERN